MPDHVQRPALRPARPGAPTAHAAPAGVTLVALVALAALVALLALAAAKPAVTLAAGAGQPTTQAVTIADAPPGEDCVDDPDAHPGVGLQKCDEPFNAGSLLPFVAGGVVVLLALVIAWFLVMRRRVSRPFLPDGPATASGTAAGGSGAGSSEDWWTCRTCGAANMVGSARCYKCGSWQP